MNLGTFSALAALVACRGVPDDSGAPSGAVDPPVVRIAELVSRNEAAGADPDGEWGDWIELANPGALPVSLDGWTITDDVDGPAWAALDGLMVPAKGRLVLWADGERERGSTHLPFSLDGDGEGLKLVDPDHQTHDALRFGALPADVALVRTEDDRWTAAVGARPDAAPTSGVETPPGAAPDGVPEPGPACGLAADLPTRALLEGDELTVTVRCEAVDRAALRLVPVGLPAGATWDEAAGVLRWELGPADAGHRPLVFASWPADGGSVPQVEAVAVEVVENPDLADAAPVDPQAYREEWGVPVVHVAMEGTPTVEREVPAVVHWNGRPYAATVEVHGRTSTKYPKLSYELNFDDIRLPVDAWGDTVQHLLLITPFDDNSYVRQRLAYDLWRATGDLWGKPRYAADPFFVVAYFDGAYQGLYHAIQKLDHDPFERQGLDGDLAVYKAVDTDANYGELDSEGAPKTSWHQGFEKVDGEPEDDWTDLDALVALTAGATPASLVAELDEVAHADEFLDWLLFVRFLAGEDSTSKNHLVVREPGGRFHYIPWDFNASFGQNWRTYRIDADFDDDFSGDNHLFALMLADGDTRERLRERGERLVEDGPFASAWLLAQVDRYYAEIDLAARRDQERWGAEYRAYAGWAEARDDDGDWTDFDGERAYLEDWIRERSATFVELLEADEDDDDD